jgi:hypothetical protein
MLAFKHDEALVADFKSGKVRNYDDKPTGQLHMSAFFIFCLYPKVNKITTSYLFLDHKQTITRVFYREEFEIMRKTFINAFTTVNNDKEFKPTVNQYCYWCKLEDCIYK